MKNLFFALIAFITNIIESTSLLFTPQFPLINSNFAKIKFGMMMTDARGKLGGQVFSKNKGGAYVRTKVTPANPQTSYQLAVRAALASISQSWKGLVQASRDAWNGAVGNFKITDIFGDVKILSGSQLYTKLNLNLTNAGQALITTPPLPQGAQTVTIDSVASDNSSNTVIITAGGAVPVGHTALVFATPAVSPGREFLKNEYRLIEAVAGGTVSPYAVSAAYNSKFGAVGAVGQRVGVKVLFVRNATGEASLGGAANSLIVV